MTFNNNWIFNPNTKYGIDTIEVSIKKILSSKIDPKILTIFDEIETYCMFLGYPSSGHTLIGSILDAHSDAIIAHELDVLKYLKGRLTKNQIFYLILKNSISFAGTGRRFSKLSFMIPNQWNGRFRSLKVIGDKKGGGSTWRLLKNPTLLDNLNKTIDVNKIKIIHIIRNPYSNITSISIKSFKNNLNKSIKLYFLLCKTIDELRYKNNNIIDFRYESFINNPEDFLKKICKHLDLTATPDYIKDCSSILTKKPLKRRFDIKWSSENINLVKNNMKEFDFLEGYSYQD